MATELIKGGLLTPVPLIYSRFGSITTQKEASRGVVSRRKTDLPFCLHVRRN